MRSKYYDPWTLVLMLGLLGTGLVMLYSSSADTAAEIAGTHTYFLRRQVVRILIGLVLFFIAFKLDYHIYQKLASWLLIISLFLLVLTLVIHSASGRTGAARWLSIGPISIQPSDFARLSLILYLAAYLERKGTQIAEFRMGLLPPVFMIGAVIVLISIAPDFSTAVLTGLLGVIILFLGGAKLKHLTSLAVVSLPFMAVFMMAEPYRRARIQTFLGFSESPEAGYQISQSLISLGNGGWLGQGLGNSALKRLFLPAPHTDFVFAIIGEELGFLGCFILLAIFFWLFQRGMVIARNAPDKFGMLLAMGIAFNLIIYVIVNIAVVTEVIPNTGIPLPLISYGGTHIVSTLISLGVLLNISSSTRRKIWERRLVNARART
ncbi:putative lipid II flippase FtsW [Candidatus Neomarinimicrobiota bacterium]